MCSNLLQISIFDTISEAFVSNCIICRIVVPFIVKFKLRQNLTTTGVTEMFGKRLLTEKQENLLKLRLKELRNSINFTQEQMAKALYVSRSCISNYESGQRAMSMEMVKKYADYFNVDANYVLGIENENHEINEYLYRKMQNSKHITPEGYLDISDLSTLDKIQIIDFCEFLRIRARARQQKKTTA